MSSERLRTLMRDRITPCMGAVWGVGYRLAGLIGGGRNSAQPWCALGGQQVVVVSPHPDDEVLGAGGVAALHAEAGDRVTFAIVTDGRSSRAGDLAPEQMAAARRCEVQRAAQVLGIENLTLLGLREGDWREEDAQEGLGPLLSNADIIYAPSCCDFHPCHLQVARVVAGLVEVRQMVRVMELGVPLTSRLVNLVADVQEVRQRKEDALREYATQVHATAPIRRLARYRSLFYGCPAVEVFLELDGKAYQEVMRAGDWSAGASPYRGIRVSPFTDPLSSLVGKRARIELGRLVDRR